MSGLEIPAVVSLISGGASIAGVAMSAAGTKKTVSAQGDMAAASTAAENAREQQMQLEAARKQREIIRTGIIARANAVSTASSQGASYGTGLEGSLAQYTGQEAAGINTNQRALGLGEDIFQANRDYASAQSRAATGQGMSSLGGQLLANNVAIGKIGSLFGSSDKKSNPYEWGTLDVYKDV